MDKIQQQPQQTKTTLNFLCMGWHVQPTAKLEKQKERIAEMVKQGKTSKQIQQTLSIEKIGLRRKELLKWIRVYKGTPKKPDSWKYTPTKYKKPVVCTVYGNVNGQRREIQFYGNPKMCGKAVSIVMSTKKAPKKRKIKVDASAFSSDPRYWLADENFDEVDVES